MLSGKRQESPFFEPWPRGWTGSREVLALPGAFSPQAPLTAQSLKTLAGSPALHQAPSALPSVSLNHLLPTLFLSLLLGRVSSDTWTSSSGVCPAAPCPGPSFLCPPPTPSSPDGFLLIPGQAFPCLSLRPFTCPGLHHLLTSCLHLNPVKFRLPHTASPDGPEHFPSRVSSN